MHYNRVPSGAAAIELRRQLQSVIEENIQVPNLYEKLYEDLNYVAPRLFYTDSLRTMYSELQVLNGFVRMTTQCTCDQFREIEELRKVYLRWSPPHATALGNLMALVENRTEVSFFGSKKTLAECLA